MEQPKSKPPKLESRKHPKSKKINVGRRGQWKRILREVDKDQVPVNFLDSITLHLIDETEVVIEVKKMLESGIDIEELEQYISDKLAKLDQYIKDVDFFISVEAVDEIVQPITNQILKDL
jgi:hypothetical protein